MAAMDRKLSYNKYWRFYNSMIYFILGFMAGVITLAIALAITERVHKSAIRKALEQHYKKRDTE